jgi:hypothetical protein
MCHKLCAEGSHHPRGLTPETRIWAMTAAGRYVPSTITTMIPQAEPHTSPSRITVSPGQDAPHCGPYAGDVVKWVV